MIEIIIAIISGLTASLGLGGGFVLVLYLAAFANMPQLQAQGINLIFFVPIALISVFLHNKNDLIEKDILKPIIIFGILGISLGIFISGVIDTKWLSKLFGVFILFIGIKEIFRKN